MESAIESPPLQGVSPKPRIGLAWQIVIGLALGIAVGLALNHFPQMRDGAVAGLLQPAGDMFIKLIRMIVVPIVFTSMVIGIAGVGDGKTLGRIGLKTLVYFEVITTIAIVLGLFTGSTAVGKLVASQAGRAMKKQVLELGGSDPFIVLADADIDVAAKAAVKARFSNTGQSCISSKRFIVADTVADRFVERFCEEVGKLKVGDPTQRDTTIGPMARANLREELHRQVERTVEAGAMLKAGGAPLPGAGFFYAPTVFDHVTPDMPAAREETFGPVAAILRVKSVDEAIELANATEFGLGAAIWTADTEQAKQLARRIEAGAVFINGLVASDARLPFGGVKQSGYGRELGEVGIREFTNIKTVWVGPAR